MDDLHFEELLDKEIGKIRVTRSKPTKRKWREIEAVRDKRRLRKELMEMDVCFEDDIDL
ncbi:DUF3545 family protein [Vibrio quintilis]|uniref:DUF3545 domain-containing protein n=1 Tax=Vibrio quintilis TaxID=1117707 RepID=A0A1M7Z0G4_9VIBR|nr:DUF3545 family protein [Vibrio quintilis]SHO58429.1 hypothetical protein VQ7734_04201 [Vibrio quintilis]